MGEASQPSIVFGAIPSPTGRYKISERRFSGEFGRKKIEMLFGWRGSCPKEVKYGLRLTCMCLWFVSMLHLVGGDNPGVVVAVFRSSLLSLFLMAMRRKFNDQWIDTIL